MMLSKLRRYWQVYLAYTAMWLMIFAGIAAGVYGGIFWSQSRTGYMLLMFAIAFGFLFVGGLLQSYAATEKMVLDDDTASTLG